MMILSDLGRGSLIDRTTLSKTRGRSSTMHMGGEQ